MDTTSANERDELMAKIMTANNLLNQMRRYPAAPAGQENLVSIMPHLSEIFGELASYIFFAPPTAPLSSADLVEYLRLQQRQTLDIWRFEAYAYLIHRLS